MAKAQAKPRTRKPKRERPGEYVGFRAPPELKKKLETTARESARSLSTEAQIRLERSFEQEQLTLDLLSEVLRLRYGAKLAALLQILATVMQAAGSFGHFTKDGVPADGMYRDAWIDSAWGFKRASEAAANVLEFLAPAGDTTPPEPQSTDDLAKNKFSFLDPAMLLHHAPFEDDFLAALHGDPRASEAARIAAQRLIEQLRRRPELDFHDLSGLALRLAGGNE